MKDTDKYMLSPPGGSAGPFWGVVSLGGSAGPFWGVVSQQDQVIATQIMNREHANLIVTVFNALNGDEATMQAICGEASVTPGLVRVVLAATMHTAKETD